MTQSSIELSTKSAVFPWKTASVLYFLAWAPSLLFLKAFFWDDWMVYFSFNSVQEKAWWAGEGFPPYVYEIQKLFLNRNPVAFHLLSLTLYFALGWLAFNILIRSQLFSPVIARRVSLIFLILPINSARAAMIILPYSISLFLFFVAWYMLLSNNFIVRALSTLCFIFSFYTTSVIPFFAIPAATFVWLGYKETRNLKSAILRRGPVVLLAPLYYLIAVRLIWPPASNRTDYFTPQLNGLIRSSILLIVSLAFSLFILFKSKTGVIEVERSLLLAVGLTSIAFGSVAYFAAGRLVDLSEWLMFIVPRASSWDSRSQLLHGLGLSLIAVGVFYQLDSPLRKAAFKAFLGACVALNFTFTLGYHVDYLKQKSVIEQISKLEITNESVIMIEDNALQFNARGRNVRWYEWDAMFFKATGKNARTLDSAFVDCNSEGLIPNLYLTLNPGRGRMSTLLKQNANIQVVLKDIDPCPNN